MCNYCLVQQTDKYAAKQGSGPSYRHSDRVVLRSSTGIKKKKKRFSFSTNQHTFIQTGAQSVGRKTRFLFYAHSLHYFNALNEEKREEEGGGGAGVKKRNVKAYYFA